MSEQSQDAIIIQERLGRFIDEAVNRAVQDQMSRLADLAQAHAEEVVAAGAARFNQTLDSAASGIQKRIDQMVEQGLRRITGEAEQLLERNIQRFQETSQKTLHDAPVTMQESLMQMIQESETLFHRRAEEWISQFRAEQDADMSSALQAQCQALRRGTLEEVAQSAKAICDRNLFDIRSDFENHVNRSFQHVAERLTAPFTRQ